MNIICATCHLFGMSSACANPFLYGWFNENFRGEFKLIFAALYNLLRPARAASDINQRRLRDRNSSATACNTSVFDTMSPLGQSKIRRIATATIDDKNKLELGQPNVTTVKEMVVMVDRQHVVETKLIEEQSNIDCPARSDEIDENIIFMHPIYSSSTLLETHL